MPNLQEMTLTDLRQLAKTFNIKNISKLKKEELIEILTQIFKEEQKKQEANNKEQIRTEKTENEKTVHENKTSDDEDETEKTQTEYDENGEPIIAYKLTNEGDEIVEGILDILPDGYGF